MIPSTIIVIQGGLGSGKTLLATYLVKKYMRLGIPAYTQHKVQGAETLETLMGLKKIKSAVVCVDDAITEGLDSYGQQSQGGRLATRILRFARKRGLIMIFTQQLETGIAKRLRRITNYIFEPETIVFPYFKVRGYTNRGVCFFDKIIKFYPEVYDSYDTEEEVFQHVELDDLEECYAVARGNRPIFNVLVTSKYQFTNDVRSAVYECLRDKNTMALDYVLEDYGYELAQ